MFPIIGLCVICIVAEATHSRWYRCCIGTSLTLEIDTDSFLYRWDATQNTSVGLLPSVLDQLADELGFTLTFSKVSSGVTVGETMKNGATGWIAKFTTSGFMASGMFAASVPNISRLHYIDLFHDTYAGLVTRTVRSPDAWSMFAPLSGGVWAMCVISICTFSITTLLIVVAEGHHLSMMRVVRVCYQSVSGKGDEASWPARILRLGSALFSLIMISTYTANLAAFFTRPHIEVGGPRDMSQLQNAVACANFPPIIIPFAASVIQSPAHLRPPQTTRLDASYEWMIARLHEKTCDVIIGPHHHLNYFLRRDCDSLAFQPDVSYGNFGTYLQLGSQYFDEQFIYNLTMAHLWLKNRPSYVNLVRNELGIGNACDYNSDAPSEEGLRTVEMSSIWILFLFSGALAALAIIVAFLARKWKRPVSTDSLNVDSFVDDSDKFNALFERIKELHTQSGKRPSGADENEKPTPRSKETQDDLGDLRFVNKHFRVNEKPTPISNEFQENLGELRLVNKRPPVESL